MERTVLVGFIRLLNWTVPFAERMRPWICRLFKGVGWFLILAAFLLLCIFVDVRTTTGHLDWVALALGVVIAAIGFFFIVMGHLVQLSGEQVLRFFEDSQLDYRAE